MFSDKWLNPFFREGPDDTEDEPREALSHSHPEEPSEYPPSMVFELTDENLKIHEENFVEYIQEIKAVRTEVALGQETGPLIDLEQELKIITLEEKKVDIKGEEKKPAMSPNSTATSTR